MTGNPSFSGDLRGLKGYPNNPDMCLRAQQRLTVNSAERSCSQGRAWTDAHSSALKGPKVDHTGSLAKSPALALGNSAARCSPVQTEAPPWSGSGST